jgi:hypothetical protein
MNLVKLKNGNKNLAILQLISTKNNSIKQSKSEIKHKDLRNVKYLNYKLFIQEKDNDILKLKNEIDYYKDCINIKLRKRNIDSINTKDKRKFNIFKINNILKFKNFQNTENGNDINDAFNQKYDSMRVKKIKLIQKKNKNFTQQFNEIKNNSNEIYNKKQNYNNSLTENKSNMYSFSINSINNSNNNDNFNLQKIKMDNLQNRMNNLMTNLFSILKSNKKYKYDK